MATVEPHPNAAELTAFSLGTLDSASLAELELHLASCQACQERAAAAPGDALIELLRRAHAQPDGLTDTATEAATPAPVAAAQAVTLALHSAALPSDTDVSSVLPEQLAQHERYRITRLLGVGGMGAVYEAEHRAMQRPVALKIINRAFTTNAGAVERFRREVRAAARLAHQNIVTAHDAEIAGDTHFLVMEYVAGTSLGRLVKDNGPLPVAAACDYVRQAALGLQHAHERGMVHRDIKPDNLMLAGGVVKVLDFGLAALAAEPTSGLTESNVIMGTPDYMAPEQAEDARQADSRADVYSLGCTLCYLLTGRVPYPAETSVRKILAHRERPVPSLRAVRPDVPKELERVLARLLAKKPEDRYQTPGAVAAALVPFLRAAPLPPRRRRRWLTAAVAAALLVAITIAGVVVYRIQTDQGELVITTESDDVEVIVKQGGKVVRIIDTKTGKQIALVLRSGVYELELKGAPAGLKLNIDRAEVTRGATVLAKIERVAGRQPRERLPAPSIDLVRRIPVFGAGDLLYDTDVSIGGKYALVTKDVNPGVRLEVYEVATGKQTLVCPGYMARFLNEKDLVVEYDNMFRVYDADTGKLLREGKHHAFGAMDLAIGGRLLFHTGAKGWYLYDLAHMKYLQEWEDQPDRPFAPVFWTFSPDGKKFAFQLKGEPVTVVDVGNNRPVKGWGGLDGAALHFIFPDGKTAAGTRNGDLVRFDLVTGRVIERLEGQPTPGALAGMYSCDGRCWVVRYPDGRLSQYRTPFGAPARGHFQLPPDDCPPPAAGGGHRIMAISHDNQFATVLTRRSLFVLRLAPLNGATKEQP
jgi:hypothetical protein